MRTDVARESGRSAAWSLSVAVAALGALGALGALAACHGGGAVPASPKLTDPTLGASPPSQPTGEPVEVHPVAPEIGSAETVTFASSKLLEIRGAKHQQNEQRARVRVKVLAVDGEHASKLEVTTVEATETIQVGTHHDKNELLEGTYIVVYSNDGNGLVATRADGTLADPGDRDSLDTLVSDRFIRDDATDMLIEHPLRVGETLPIQLDLSGELYGAEPTGHSTVSLLSADATIATYQVDFAVTAREPNLIGDIDIKGRRTLVLDRAHGRITSDKLMTYKTERHAERAADTQSEQSITRSP